MTETAKNKDCEICEILATQNGGQDCVLLETDLWRVVLDSNQRFLGKAFVTLLNHKETVSQLNSDEWSDLHAIMRKLEKSTKIAFSPTHFNWLCLMNLAAWENKSTHVHWHFHPRYDQPVDFAGETFVDAEYLKRALKTDHNVGDEILRKISQKLKEEF